MLLMFTDRDTVERHFEKLICYDAFLQVDVTDRTTIERYFVNLANALCFSDFMKFKGAQHIVKHWQTCIRRTVEPHRA